MIKKLLLLVLFYFIKNKVAKKSPSANLLIDMAITKLLTAGKR